MIRLDVDIFVLHLQVRNLSLGSDQANRSILFKYRQKRAYSQCLKPPF